MAACCSDGASIALVVQIVGDVERKAFAELMDDFYKK
jgi:hypothetical protein